MKIINAVFEGGGIKGIGIIGAVAATLAAGFSFDCLAGTSAGAIVAALLAAGYTANECDQILMVTDFRDFQERTLSERVFGLAGYPLSLAIDKGLFSPDFFETWLSDLLIAKNVATFGDLKKADGTYRLKVIASDITAGAMIVLPDDLQYMYGIDPDTFPVATAVRMSMSIPFYFTPYLLKGHYIVDGGILSNYPVWLFDNDPTDPSPTIGYKLVDPTEGQPHKIYESFTMFKALFDTMLEAHDARYIEDKQFIRTVPIPTLGVKTTEFNLSDDRKHELWSSGNVAATEFFKTWDFIDFKEKYITNISRSNRV